MITRRAFGKLVGLLFLGYALAFSLRPDAGVIGYTLSLFQLAPLLLIAGFACNGIALLLFQVTPAWFFFLLSPLLLTTLGSIVRALAMPTASVSAFLGYGVPWLLITLRLWEYARQGDGSD